MSRAVSMGTVTNSSTSSAVRATNNEDDPVNRVPAQSVEFQALAANTGVIYICDRQTPNVSTGVGIIHEIPAPSDSAATGTRPSWSVGNPTQPTSLDVKDLWILPAVADEGCRVSRVTS